MPVFESKWRSHRHAANLGMLENLAENFSRCPFDRWTSRRLKVRKDEKGQFCVRKTKEGQRTAESRERERNTSTSGSVSIDHPVEIE